jgi:hypothetical protein
MLKQPNESKPEDNSRQVSELHVFNIATRSDTLKMAMSILDLRTQRELENQQLLPAGRQAPVASYTTEELITEAQKLLDFVTDNQ